MVLAPCIAGIRKGMLTDTLHSEIDFYKIDNMNFQDWLRSPYRYDTETLKKTYPLASLCFILEPDDLSKI